MTQRPRELQRDGRSVGRAVMENCAAEDAGGVVAMVQSGDRVGPDQRPKDYESSALTN